MKGCGANDSLSKEGIKINLLAYDTERNPNELERSKNVVKKFDGDRRIKEYGFIGGPAVPGR